MEPEITVVGTRLALAIGLGLLVGFQREWAASHVAGLRTFALISLLGAMLALLAPAVGDWLVPAGLLAVTSMLIVGYVIRLPGLKDKPGLTTQMAALVMYSVGAAIGLGYLEWGTIVGGGTAVLLHWKLPLHNFVERMGESDVRAIIQLVLIALVILPLMPHESYGPDGVLNPFEIWLMVVLIVGISLGSYIAYKLLGVRTGTALAGILGGLISSTATTVSYARQSRHVPSASPLSAAVIMMASTVVFVRVLVEVAIVAPNFMVSVAPPLIVMMTVMTIIAWELYRMCRVSSPAVASNDAPSDLRAAVLFGLMYAAILVAVAFARQNFGDRGLYTVAALSGLTDMDAITLSTAQMIKRESISPTVGWRMILVGGLSNLIFKGAAIGLLGHPQLQRRMALALGLSLLTGGLLLAFWPS